MNATRFRGFKTQTRLSLFLAISILVTLTSLPAETPLDRSSALEARLRVSASRFQNKSREQLSVDLRRGIGPDDAATIALYSNPALRAIRDRRGLAAAQVIQAGILPNPVVSYERDFVTGGSTAGTRDGYTFSAGWEFTALIPFLPKQTAARKNFQSVDLDVAWQEWQIVVNARVAVYRIIALDSQVERAREATSGLEQSAEAMQKAVDAHEKTVLDLSAVESASQDS